MLSASANPLLCSNETTALYAAEANGCIEVAAVLRTFEQTVGVWVVLSRKEKCEKKGTTLENKKQNKKPIKNPNKNTMCASGATYLCSTAF